MSTKALTLGIAAVLIVGIGVITLATGDHGESSASAKETDGAFVVEMVPHHESAIEMANVAQRRAEHPQVKRLAAAIIAAQEREINELAAIHQALFKELVAQGDHGSLGLESHQMGMDSDPTMLAKERPFDRAFVDMMIPHHQGAIRMARVELQSGEDARLTRIAKAIVAAQSREINEMNAWRRDWYGAPSPAGGIPPEEESMPSDMMMNHG